MRHGAQADADIPLPDEGPNGGEPSQADSRVTDAMSDGEDEVQQSHAGSDGDDGEDLLENAQA